jgi:hypothetical protein
MASKARKKAAHGTAIDGSGLIDGVRWGRHLRGPRFVSPPEGCAVRRRFSAGLARGLADPRAERRPETALSGAIFSEPGDLGDLPARLKAAEILGLLRQKGGGVGAAHAPPIPRGATFAECRHVLAGREPLKDDGLCRQRRTHPGCATRHFRPDRLGAPRRVAGRARRPDRTSRHQGLCGGRH